MGCWEGHVDTYNCCVVLGIVLGIVLSIVLGIDLHGPDLPAHGTWQG
jgi:hypothetical protein